MYYIGIDLGGTNIAAGIVDESYKIIKKASTPTKARRPADEIVADMAKLCADLIADCGITVDQIRYVGIATPGTANSDTGVVEYANNLPFLRYPIADKLKEKFPVKAVYIENDANAAAKGEAVAGVAKGAKYSVMITLGTGVGGGMVFDGKVYSGFNYAGAELGHMVIEHNGKHCSCGRRGCWEAYSSATGLIRMTREKLEKTPRDATVMWEMIDGNLDNVSGKTAFAAARRGDCVGQEVVDEYISYLACGITNIINIFQPNVLSIGGGICNERDFLLKPLMEIVNRDQYTRNSDNKTQVKIAALGNDAGILGAALLRV